MVRQSWIAIMLTALIGMTLVGCNRGDAEPPVEEAPAAVEEEAPSAEEPEQADEPDEPEESMTDRTGAWLDRLVVVEEPNADAAISRLEAGDIDIYAFTISSPGTYARIQESDSLDYKTSFGSFSELTFNPAACADESKLNPFAEPKIREAMNWLVDREYIIAEIMGGLGTPRYVPINGASADRGRLASEIRAIEAKYAHDADQALQVVTEEMEALGASLDDEGKWTFAGEPVELIGIIRTEDERRQIGDYFAAQLEDIGFTVQPDYKTSAEAAPIWQRSEPTECLFNFYTGGWVSTAINRDASTNFNFFYTPAGLPRPLWQAYTPTEAFESLAQRLNDSEFGSLDERTQMFAEALPMALEDSSRIWLLDRSSVAPHRDDVSVSADLSGSIYGTLLWPYTLRKVGEEGGELTWASASILTEAWNPVAGTNWIYDSALYRSTGQTAVIPDPNTGLNWPQRLESLEVTVQEGLPVGRSLDWLSLEFSPEIVVPDDAWADWDAGTQTFVSAGDFYTETATALVKLTSTYPADLFETNSWHDGSALSPADMVMRFIMAFDQAKEDSAIYDEAQVPSFESFMSTFKGLRIVSTSPMVVEFYTDNWSLDAENAVTSFRAMWPGYAYGEAPWHTVALGVLGEENGLATFSVDKSTANEVEQFNYIAGPTLDILGEQLTAATEAGHIPYAATMEQFVTAEEAQERYGNLASWVEDRGHYWVGTGPFSLQEAYPVEGTIVLDRNENFPDSSDKWARFAAPAIAEVEVDGPGRVTAGESADFDVLVNFDGEPYAIDDVQEVKYLAFDASGDLVTTGSADAVEDGVWSITLGADMTEGLEAGSNRLEVVVVPKLVALPSLGDFSFVTTP